MSSANTKPKGLEKTLADLETLVQKLEEGDLSLESALKEYEKGVKLTRECQAALKEAELKVEILKTKNADAPASEFDAGGDGS